MPSPTLSARLFKFGIGLTLVITGLAVTALMFIPYHRGKETRSWPETPCVITESYEKEGSLGDLTSSSHRVFLRYRYTIGGQEYTSTHLQRRTFAGADDADLSFKTAGSAEAKKLLDKYPVNLKTTCWVNPADPADALLEHQSTAAIYTLWFPMLFAVGGAGIAWSALRRNKTVTQNSAGASPLPGKVSPD